MKILNRRNFIGAVFASTIVASLNQQELKGAQRVGDENQPQIALTFDDFRMFDAPILPSDKRNQAILNAMSNHNNLKAAVFVAGRNIDTEEKRRFLADWNTAGHTIGNHTYSHLNLNNTDFETFSCDFMRGEAVIQDFRNFKKLFRFPYLKEGDTAQKRDRMRTFLKEKGYRQGRVTVDASDWYVDQRLRERLKKEPKANLDPYRKFYLEHLWDRAQYYDNLTRKVIGRTVKHNLLLHHNVVNGLFLKDVLAMFTEKGWKLIDAETAFADPVYQAEPKNVPAGESLIWALAKESGKFEKELRYPGESEEYEKPKMEALGL